MTDVPRTHFIRQLIEEDLASGKHSQIVTRFPPEPNGYLHIGHAKSICLNFGLARDFNGDCFLRFDDTNPIKEEEEYVQSIIKDVAWLGFQWKTLTYCSDNYDALYTFACDLIERGLAYVDSLTMAEIREHRGTLQEPGRESPYRTRSVAENRDLFTRMKAGEFADGTHVLRAKIDMASPNLNMRDPVIYRIRHAYHQRTKDAWCIYPMYDYAHPITDALEGITHSLCTLEFQDHRPLYDWCIENLPLKARPVQTEFSRLNLSHTVTSKRWLKRLVDEKVVTGWDDPRMPTISGMRRRGFPPEAIRAFCEQVGISRADGIIDMGLLESCVREVLNHTAQRALCVLNPLKVILEDLPQDEMWLDVPWSSGVEGTRKMPLTREIFIEQSDFMAEPEKGFFRLSPGAEVRLRHAYVIRCESVEHDANGEITTLHCRIDPTTLGKNPEGRKVKGVIHWVSATQGHPIQIEQYDRLFTAVNPMQSEDLLSTLNPDSKVIVNAIAEPAIAAVAEDAVFQFERVGYYQLNTIKEDKAAVFHRIVELKDRRES